MLFKFVLNFVKSICIVPRVDDTNVRNNDVQARKPFSLEEIYSYVFYSYGFNGTWISDNEFIVENIISGDITVINVKTGETKKIFDGKDLPVRTFYNLLCNSSELQSVIDTSLSRRYYEI